LSSQFSLPQVILPTAHIKANGFDGSTTIAFGSSATLSWTSLNADACLVSPGGWTTLSNAGVSTGNLSTSTTYSLMCSNANGDATDTVTVNVLAAPIADTQPPTVAITEPLLNSILSNKEKMSAVASDNVGVTKVIFFIDDTALGADTSGPYSVSFLTNRLSSGNHLLRAVAYDAAGNSATSEILVSKR
jgi:hypothetical protein